LELSGGGGCCDEVRDVFGSVSGCHAD